MDRVCRRKTGLRFLPAVECSPEFRSHLWLSLQSERTLAPGQTQVWQALGLERAAHDVIRSSLARNLSGSAVHIIRDADAAASSIRERELKFQAAGDPPTPNLANLDYCRQLVQIYLTAGERLANSANYRRVQFEELQANPPAMLERLANFCGLRATTQQLAAAAASIRPARVRSTS